ncbi:flavin reductase family protein [Gordonia rubripertincta]|uniref:flavin reductase family protein n=1 Tax=Gordonia rubripertincta TaxID=36822 RepID=UPI000B8DACF8|nr:flavin reductase family protein [Gordonia rubripertincta]ASR03175.1 Flavoredoxin [Gordonia rubripertincta]
MNVDTDAANKVLGGLRPYPVAITTVDGGFANGLMSLSAGAASIIPEAPRATVSLTKYNMTHDMLLNSGVFAMHMLSAGEDEVDASLEILMTLGGSSGRDGDKIGKLRTKTGVTGAPILLDAHSYVECKVIGSLDVQESTIFVGDVVAAEVFSQAPRIKIGEAWGKLPDEWIEQYDANHVPQLQSAKDHRFGQKV